MNQARIIILCLFALGLLTSIAAQEAAIALLFLLAVYTMVSQREYSIAYLRSGLDWPILYIFLACLLGLFWNGVTPERLSSFSATRWFLIFYILYFTCRQLSLPKNLKPILVTFSIAVIILGIYAGVQYFLGLDLIRGGRGKVQLITDTTFRAVGTFSNPITFGNAMAMVACFLYGFRLKYKSSERFMQLLLWLATILAICAVGFTYTRGAMVGMVCGLVFVGLLGGAKTARATWLMLALGLFAVMFVDLPLFDRLRSIFILDGKQASRLFIWQAHIAMFFEHPIFGVGYNYNAWMVEKYFHQLSIPLEFHQYSHAHNNIIQFLGGTGITGTLGYLWLTAAVIKHNLSALKSADSASRDNWQSGLALGFLGLHIAFFVSGMTESTFRDSELRNQFLFFLVLFLIANPIKKNK